MPNNSFKPTQLRGGNVLRLSRSYFAAAKPVGLTQALGRRKRIMLGWTIFISRLPDGGLVPAHADSMPGETLATWHTGIGGTRWINSLVETSEAIDLGGNGYPLKYTAPAGLLLPHVVRGWPKIPDAPNDDSFAMAYGHSTPIINSEEMERCTEGEWLLVEAWDAS